jgi:hypothetical protein
MAISTELLGPGSVGTCENHEALSTASFTLPPRVHRLNFAQFAQQYNPHICEDPEGNRRSFWRGWLWGAATMAAVVGVVALIAL